MFNEVRSHPGMPEVGKWWIPWHLSVMIIQDGSDNGLNLMFIWSWLLLCLLCSGCSETDCKSSVQCVCGKLWAGRK